MFSRLFRSQSLAEVSEPATQTTLAQARRWQRWLRWLAWLVPVAISVGVYAVVWYGLVLPGQSLVGLREAANIIFISALVALVLGIFIYQIQIIFAQQVAASADLERKVQERTEHITQVMLKLDEQNKALVALDQQKSEFVTLVSHELRAPLTNINGGLELLLSREHDLSPRTRNTLELVVAEAERLTHFVETILNISALESGQLPVVTGPVSVPAAIRHVLGQFSNLPASTVTTNLDSNLPLVLADERFLQSVLFHLVDNAVKYAPHSPILLQVQVVDKQIEIRVKDEGPGIAPEAAAQIFNRFERLDARDSQSVYGYGLGLYMCKLIASALKGDIYLESTSGKGATFVVCLPVWVEDSHIIDSLEFSG
jgi:signal transduction histidine kinase